MPACAVSMLRGTLGLIGTNHASSAQDASFATSPAEVCRCSITGTIGPRRFVKILISYLNFVRDYRGSLLLKYALEALGHRVWLRPRWDEVVRFSTVKEVDVVIACQIAEDSTSYIGKFTSAHGVHLVINSSEQVAAPEMFESLV